MATVIKWEDEEVATVQIPNKASPNGLLGDEVGHRQGRPLALRVTVGGLLYLGCLEERESWTPWLAFPVSTFPFPKATHAE